MKNAACKIKDNTARNKQFIYLGCGCKGVSCQKLWLEFNGDTLESKQNMLQFI